MKLTSDTANKTIKNLQAEMDAVLAYESQSRTYSHGPTENPIVPAYDFNETETKLDAIRGKIAVLKHAVNRFNMETIVPGLNITVDEALGRMAWLHSQKKRLYNMLQIPETGRQRAYGGREPDITHRNFDPVPVKARYDEVCQELMDVQQAINIANLTVTFEVDLSE